MFKYEENANYPRDYIGDGVYASFDGYHIWLETQEGMQIALEPQVMVGLIRFEAVLRSKLPR